jgi:tripartite-type tricarboxylate transporter receptor subunit TctC
MKKILLLALVSLLGTAAIADPLELVVPFPPGVPTDSFARSIQFELSQKLSEPVIVFNKAGGNGSIASTEFPNRSPDNKKLYDKLCAALFTQIGM